MSQAALYLLASMALSPNAYVILGMLKMGARSGYDIRLAAERSTRIFWTLSPAQIYPLLKELERKRLIEGHADPVGKRKRRLYELAPEGEAALRDWLGDSTQDLAFEVRDVATLKLFFADYADEDHALEHVRTMRSRSESIVEYLQRESEPAALQLEEQGRPSPRRVLTIGIAIHRAIAEQCAEIEADLTRSGSGGRSDRPQ